MAKANVEIPWGKDCSGTLDIFVNKVFDLNSFIDTLETGEAQQTKTFGCLCWASGPISINVVLNKSGYVCGEKIDIDLKVKIQNLDIILPVTYRWIIQVTPSLKKQKFPLYRL